MSQIPDYLKVVVGKFKIFIFAGTSDMKNRLILATFFITLLFGASQAQAVVVGVGFTSLTGTTPQETGVFKAELSGTGLTELASIRIRDTGGTAGSPGIWSGFDLAGIKLSTTDCADAGCADGLAGLPVFDFVNNVLFNAGSIDPVAPTDPLAGPCLAGTTGVGCEFDDSLATLADFDATFNTPSPGDWTGFLSMGRLGTLALDLTSAVLLNQPLYLYVGEVGNNGETLRGLVEISDVPTIPVPAAFWLFGTALVGFIGMSRRRKVG